MIARAIATGTVALGLLSTASAHGSSGSWERTWGGDVDASGGSGAGEICTVETNCQPGSGFGRGGEFGNPRAVAADAAGNVYVAEQINQRIQKFDPAGNFLRAWGKDVSTAPGTGFEVCTSAASCQAGGSGGLGGEFNNPAGVATDGAGNVYVADTGNNRIQKFDSAGNFLRAWGKDVSTAAGTDFEICTNPASCQSGSTGGLGGEFRTPIGIAEAALDVYVADFLNHRIQVFDTAGNFVRTWGKDVDSATPEADFEICVSAPGCQPGSVGDLGGELAFPVAVAANETNVFVADSGNQRIQRFQPSGFFVLAWGKHVHLLDGGLCTVAAECTGGFTGSLGGEFDNPFGVAIDGPSAMGLFIPSIYVAEYFIAGAGNNRIQQFDMTGRFLSAWGKDVDASVGSGYEVCRYAPDCQAGSVGGLGGELNNPLSVATGPSGAVYVGDNANQRIQKYMPEPAPSLALAAGAGLLGCLARCGKRNGARR